MRSTQTSLFCAIAVLGLSLMAAGCSDNQSDTESVDSAEQRVEQANAELEQAQQNLADTKAEAKAKADAETESSNKASATNTQQTTKRETTSSREQSASRPAERSSTPADSEAREQASTSSAPPVCDNCGTVTSIVPVRQNVDSGSGVGAVAGGVAGGALGSQIGSGTGKTIAAIAGALGGAYAGNYAEKKIRKTTVYQVNVAMDAGGSRQVTVDTTNGLSNGTRVRVVGNNVALMQ
ncbi:glycine zipper 2TM domain-containing protein [uncultured Salinisphaera sp.]|uniref:glycine zipper 2TM domain-containing protein n=1 Tax=uncultured Salinisphaera sp. TaxID=359372 RepID=UPI0032B12FD3|tara:strand:+ start:4961 stop:5671 length:711 start_codon:yes stop_codon:yes gene_type:complete